MFLSSSVKSDEQRPCPFHRIQRDEESLERKEKGRSSSCSESSSFRTSESSDSPYNDRSPRWSDRNHPRNAEFGSTSTLHERWRIQLQHVGTFRRSSFDRGTCSFQLFARTSLFTDKHLPRSRRLPNSFPFTPSQRFHRSLLDSTSHSSLSLLPSDVWTTYVFCRIERRSNRNSVSSCFPLSDVQYTPVFASIRGRNEFGRRRRRSR